MGSLKVDNKITIKARGKLTSVKEIRTDDKHRLLCTIRTGPGEEVPFSAGHEEIIARLKNMKNGTYITMRGFGTFRRDQLGGVDLSINTWGDNISSGVEPCNPDNEPHCTAVATGFITELEEDKGVINAQSFYQEKLRDSEIPVTFTEEVIKKIQDEDIKVGDQVTVFAEVHFARQLNEKYEVTTTVKCEVNAEEIFLVERGVGKANSIDNFVL